MILATPVAQVLLGELAAVDADLGRAPEVCGRDSNTCEMAAAMSFKREALGPSASHRFFQT